MRIGDPNAPNVPASSGAYLPEWWPRARNQPWSWSTCSTSYEHDDAEPLTKSAETILDPMSKLIARAQDKGVSSEELAQQALDGARQCILYSALDADVRLSAAA